MPILLPKHQVGQRDFLRDARPASVRIREYFRKTDTAAMMAFGAAGLYGFGVWVLGGYFDLWALIMFWYLRWYSKKPLVLPFKLPRYANCMDPNNPPAGKTGAGKADGILFLGNVSDTGHDDFGGELWLTNADARTHILYLGTTGAGKTEGLKAMVTNALAWGSGYAYTDGKADTDLWASLYSIARRFGRDDDLLLLNYMTGNSDDGALSNTMNPFSNGSASYLANMVVSFMPDAGGDNAMWKERAVALMFALMPALTFKRDKQGLLLDVGIVRDYIELQPIIRLSRDTSLPERILHGIQGYLRTLPGYVDAAFDDDGNEKPPSPDQPMYDLQVARQQHGYLSMQFTRALQSLADEYGYIFKAQLADIDVLDVVLNRRILVVLIPALEKSGDEAANLGKIVAASLKGMMGATLGNTVEGSWETAIGSKQTRSSSSFMTVFDEVGYYTAQGMAVMAAQARSLGFSLIFASQDLPSMEKRVKQEAKSIVGNCNLKILGRLEDPTDTRDFVSKHGGTSFVMETKGMTAPTNTLSNVFLNQPYYDDRGAAYVIRQRVDYDHLRGQREGEAHLIFGDWAVKAMMFFVLPEKQKALRVHRMLPVPGTTPSTVARERAMNELISRLKDPDWTASGAQGAAKASPDLNALVEGVSAASKAGNDPAEVGPTAIAHIARGEKVAAEREPVEEHPAGKTAAKVSSPQSTKPAGLKPVDAAVSKPKVAATETMVSVPRANVADIPVIGAAPLKASKASQTPLVEGDQFTIENVEQTPAATQSLAGGAQQAATAKAAKAQTKDAKDQGFKPEDADMALMRMQSKTGEKGVFDVPLPEEMKDLMAQSARILNEGLSGKTKSGE